MGPRVPKSLASAARRRHAGKHALAIIVVAHKMVAIMRHMLKTGIPHESRDEDLQAQAVQDAKKALGQGLAAARAHVRTNLGVSDKLRTAQPWREADARSEKSGRRALV